MGIPLVDDQLFSVESTIDYIDAEEKTINEVRIHTRRPDIYPFDTVAGEMLAKVIALSRCAIFLVQEGYQDEAFGLCRSLYECCIYLRYISGDKDHLHERARKFLEFGLTSKSFWFDLLIKSPSLTQEERDDIERYKRDNGIPDDPKIVTRPWAGFHKIIEKVSKQPHPLDSDDSTEDLRDRQRAMAYTDTSSFVHCTQPGLNAYSYEWTEPILIRKSRKLRTDTVSKTCAVIRVHLREAIKYCLYGMNAFSAKDLKTK
jgi:hypothetical protein